jgi:pilus assembly protein CpaC
MNAGQTLALAGLIQTQIEAETRGVPWLADLPWFGTAFRHVREQANEIELLILVTPEFVDALDPQDGPPCGPGELTTSPNDVELYLRGYLEVPRTGDNCRGNGEACSPTFLMDQSRMHHGETIMTPPPSVRPRMLESAGQPGWPASGPRAGATLNDDPGPQPSRLAPAGYQR